MENEIKKEIDFINQKLNEIKKVNTAILLYVTLVPLLFLLFVVCIICKGG